MIEVLHYEHANKNKIIGYVDIKVSVNGLNMIIRKIAHFQSGDRKWFNLPSFGREGSDGNLKYLKYWQFEQEAHNGQLLEALAEKVKLFCKDNNIKETENEPLSFHKPAANIDVLPF